jgi:hypothetical protein
MTEKMTPSLTWLDPRTAVQSRFGLLSSSQPLIAVGQKLGGRVIGRLVAELWDSGDPNSQDDGLFFATFLAEPETDRLGLAKKIADKLSRRLTAAAPPS